jgi:hypothetical protein
MTNPINANLPINEKQIIDLAGHQGNAFYLLGAASVFAQKLGYTLLEIDALNAEMKSSDYTHLLEVFETHFSEHVTLINKDND